MGHWCLVYAAVVASACYRGVVQGCNVRELSEVVQRRFKEEVASQCSYIGDKCSFDRECCKGLECVMSASPAGVGLSCQRAVLFDPDRADMMWDTQDSLPKEPKSDNVDWMVVKSEEDKEEEEGHQESTEDSNEKTYPTDMLAEIESLQKKKKQKLLRENYELEKLFTEKEEKELEQLKMLIDDAETDEVRRLKELRLKRKMQLIKELQELRGLKAEEKLNTLDELKKRTKTNNTEEKPKLPNKTVISEYNYSNNSNPGTPLDEISQSQNTVTEPQDSENSAKLKQGIHDVHHKRKHHHHKRKDPHLTSQSVYGSLDGKENGTEYNAE